MKDKCIIVDIDGTIALDKHGEIIPTDFTREGWNEFHKHMDMYDADRFIPIWSTINMIKCIVNDSFTVSLWIRPEVLYQWTAALYVKHETGFLGIIPYSWEGCSDCRIRDSKEVTGWYDLSGRILTENTWWHYVATYNAKTETAIAFINGDVVSILENVPTNRYVKRITLGGDVFQSSLQGDICEVVFYNEAKDFEFVYELHQSYVTRKDFIGFQIDTDAL